MAERTRHKQKKRNTSLCARFEEEGKKDEKLSPAQKTQPLMLLCVYGILLWECVNPGIAQDVAYK